jgi:hypothetical protein
MSVVPISDTQELPQPHNPRKVPSTQSTTSIDGGGSKRLKRFGTKEVTPEMVEKLRLEVASIKKQSWYSFFFGPDSLVIDDRVKNNIVKKEYWIMRNNYIRQEVIAHLDLKPLPFPRIFLSISNSIIIIIVIIKKKTRRGRGCVGCLPKGILEEEGGKIRQFFLSVCEHPKFDQFIMICILVNCVFLALSDPTANEEPQYQEVVKFVYPYITQYSCTTSLIYLSRLLPHRNKYFSELLIILKLPTFGIFIPGWIYLSWNFHN